MRGLLACLVLLCGCVYMSNYHKSECVRIEFREFYKPVCDGAVLRIDSNYATKKYVGTVQPEFVAKGCPEKVSFAEWNIKEKVICPNSLKN